MHDLFETRLLFFGKHALGCKLLVKAHPRGASPTAMVATPMHVAL